MTIFGQGGDGGILIRRGWRCRFSVFVTALSIIFVITLLYRVIDIEDRR